MKGKPLESYLQDTPHELSADELDRQLFDARTQPRRTATSQRAPDQGIEDINGLFDATFDQIIANEENKSLVDSAVKTASHGIKVLAPLMCAVSRWHDPSTEPEKVEKSMGSVLKRLHQDTRAVAEAYKVKADEAPAWLLSQISGQLMNVLVEAINRNNGSVLVEQDQRYLMPLLNLANQAEHVGESPYANPNDTQWTLINSLMTAASTVMTEYQNFSYFHEDPAAVSQLVTEHLHERVIEGTLAQLTERWGLNEQERGYMGASLIKQAGLLLAAAWSDCMIPTLSEIKALPTDAKRELMVTGYPLDVVFDHFENAYQGLEVSAVGALRAMNPMREKAPTQQHKSGLSNA